MTWIGITITIDDIVTDLDTFSGLNVISKKDLHSLLGKLGHVSGLLFVMRPFMQPMWAAHGSPSPEGRPGCIWARQIETETMWLRVIFTGNGASVERFFSLHAYNRLGTIVEIGTDAPPWGLGGWLAIYGDIKEDFSSPTSDDDVAKYGYAFADNKGQQVWEALAIPVAVDRWSSHWNRQRIVLEVKGDNVTSLVLLIKLA